MPFVRRVSSAARRDLPTPGDPTTTATRAVEPSTARFARDEALPRIRWCGDHLAVLEPDPDLDRDAMLGGELLVERRDARADVERGSGCAQGVVFVRRGDP